MSVKTGRTVAALAVGTGDTTILDVLANTSIKVEALTGHSTAATVVTIYSSPNLTSASGTIIDIQELAIGELVDFDKVINHGFRSDQNIIAKATNTGCNVKMSYTLYDGADRDDV